MPLEAFVAAFEQHNRGANNNNNNNERGGSGGREREVLYHVFGDCSEDDEPDDGYVGPGTNVYVVDPTGEAVQASGVTMTQAETCTSSTRPARPSMRVISR